MSPVPERPSDNLFDRQLDRRFTELETRIAFQEHALNELSDALADARAQASRNHLLLEKALEDLKQLRTLLYSDPASEPPPSHY